MANVEFDRLGLFFTLGKITPRFLFVDLCELDDKVGLMGLVIAGGEFEVELIDDVDADVGSGATVDVIIVPAGVSVAKSSVTPSYLIGNETRRKDYKKMKNKTETTIRSSTTSQ